MRSWTKEEIAGALRWLGHSGNSNLAMLREVLDGLPPECLEGDDEAQRAVEYLQGILDTLVPAAVMEALITVWSHEYAGRVDYELPAEVKRLARERQDE